uniref:Uncharacterized protein n=1 Tax=Glossina brevipalpis TaxID=37001 RepID=A0A1A9WZM7_9MUSC
METLSYNEILLISPKSSDYSQYKSITMPLWLRQPILKTILTDIDKIIRLDIQNQLTLSILRNCRMRSECKASFQRSLHLHNRHRNKNNNSSNKRITKTIKATTRSNTNIFFSQLRSSPYKVWNRKEQETEQQCRKMKNYIKTLSCYVGTFMT